MRMTKKITSIVLAVMMVVSMMSVMAVTANAIGEVVPESKYLTFTAEEANSSVTLKFRYGSNFKYNKNDSGWQDYTKGTQITLNDVGDYVRFSGKDAEFNDYNHFSLTGKVAASGNVMSLRLDDNGKSQGLINYCYQYMFSDCTSLTQAPELPETTLATYCYGAMFVGCTNLTKAPDLPATNLADYCYRYMFRGCENLTELPALRATTLADNCYAYMFYGCSKIRISDVAGTFDGITYSAEYRIPSTGTGTSAEDALDDMFGNTGGKFEGTPNINTTYYLPAPAPATPKVAEVNGTQYDTLEEALAAAPSGATVKLLEDIDFSEVTTNRNAHDTGDELTIDLKDLTLDLNGKTITTVNASVVFTGNGATIENGNFALKHVKADGTTYQAGSYGLCIDGYDKTNSITLNDLTVEGGINIWDADVVINDVTATATASNFYAIWAEGNSNVVVNSGTFSDNGTAKAKGPIATEKSGTGTLVTVKGGTFNATNKVVNAAAPGSVKFEGGTCTKPVPEQYCADGYIPKDNGNNTYGVKVGTYVAQVGTTKYENLQDALDVVPDGGTVTVLKDIATSGNIFADGYVSGGNRTYTVDLGGYTVSGATFIVDSGNNVTFKNGTIESATYGIQNKATATVDSTATVKSTSASASAVYGAAGSTTNINGTVEGNKYGVIVRGGTLNVAGEVTAVNTGIDAIDGGIANLNDGADVSGKFAIVAHKDSTVNVNGGNVEGTSHAVSGNGKAADGPYTINVTGGTLTATDGAAIYNPNATGTMNISGGTITGSTSAVTAGADSTNSISGGTFNTPVPEEYCANGYVPKDNGNGTYGVGPDTSSPLNPLMVAAADINDHNAFEINSDYLRGTLLGVQKKNAIDDAEITSESHQENGSDMRFVAVLDTDLVQDADDYGFVLAKVGTNKNCANTNFDNLKVDMGNGEKTISAKGTYNTVCGTEYGDPASATPYKYITCAVNSVDDSSKIVARFYYKKDGVTYYAKYAGHNYKYTGCTAGINASGNIY